MGRQVRILFEEIEEMVVQDFHLPHGAVAGVDLNGAVIRRDGACPSGVSVQALFRFKMSDWRQARRLSSPGLEERLISS